MHSHACARLPSHRHINTHTHASSLVRAHTHTHTNTHMHARTRTQVPCPPPQEVAATAAEAGPQAMAVGGPGPQVYLAPQAPPLDPQPPPTPCHHLSIPRPPHPMLLCCQGAWPPASPHHPLVMVRVRACVYVCMCMCVCVCMCVARKATLDPLPARLDYKLNFMKQMCACAWRYGCLAMQSFPFYPM